jgi:hypothetical protein
MKKTTKTQTNSTKIAEQRNLRFRRVPAGDITRNGDFREWKDGRLWPAVSGILIEKEDDPIWRLDETWIYHPDDYTQSSQ